MLDQARDAATQQTAAGYPLVKTIDTSFSFTREEVSVLRALAWQVAEISQRPVMAEKARLWTAHNDLQTQQPLVFIDPENGWNEMIPVHTLRCSDPLARVWEMALRKQIYWANVLKDDKVIEPFFDVPYSYTDTGWGVELKKRRTVENGSYIVEPAVEEFESVFEKLHHPEIVVDWKESELLMQMAHSVFDIARMEVTRDTAEYARSLGMDTMVQMMIQETSLEFRKVYPNARYFGCEWVKDDGAAPQTVPFLYPDDPLYKTLVKTFVETWVETYGPSRHFTACPPSEHHISTDIDDFININLDFAKYTYEAVREIVPDARFFFDGWGVRANTPPSIWTMPGVMQRFVDALPEEVYFLDLWPNRKETESTFREPMYRDANYGPLRKARYVLEPLNEFGGDDHMHGDFERHIEAAREMTDPSVVEHGEGFGNCTELCGVSNHFFDLIFKLAWRPEDVTLEGFLQETARQRYGAPAAPVGVQALAALQQAVYSDRDSSHARYQKRCYLARPQRRLVPVEESLEVVKLLDEYMQTMADLPDEAKNRFVGRDMFDVMRQYITEYFNMHLRTMFELFRSRGNHGDIRAAFEGHAAILEHLLMQLEWMTRQDEESYVETMVRRYEGRPCDPDVSGADCTPVDFRAWMRDMGTTFAKSIPNLIDYPSRDYYELIEGYYHPRVSACINYLRTLVDDGGATETAVIDSALEDCYHAVETRWIEEGYPVTDECEQHHLPLWRAAQDVWRTLRTLPLDRGLDIHWEDAAGTEVIDVFASFSENADDCKREERSWVSKNPFKEKE